MKPGQSGGFGLFDDVATRSGLGAILSDPYGVGEFSDWLFAWSVLVLVVVLSWPAFFALKALAALKRLGEPHP